MVGVGPQALELDLLHEHALRIQRGQQPEAFREAVQQADQRVGGARCDQKVVASPRVHGACRAHTEIICTRAIIGNRECKGDSESGAESEDLDLQPPSRRAAETGDPFEELPAGDR